jgi:hypothetical protein
MGVAFEIGKIASVSFLHFHWKKAPFLIKSYLIMAVFVLMFINSMGDFGYLSKAHIEQEVNNSSKTNQIEITLSKIEYEKSFVADIDKQIAQIDNNIDKLTATGRAASSLQAATQQRKQRDSLTATKLTHLNTLQGLNSDKINAEAANKKLEADFGPLKYIADAIYSDPSSSQLENVVRWIIIVLVLVLDPLALSLLVAAQFVWKKDENDLTNDEIGDIMTIDNSKFKV